MTKENAVLRHVVLFAFKADAGDGVREVEEAFCRLPQLLPQILHFEWGTDVSIENVQHGFTHCFVLSFASAEERDQYLVHPQHQAFGQLAQPYFEKVLVVDYWAEYARTCR